MVMSLLHNSGITCLMCGCSIMIFPMGCYMVCEIEFSQMGENRGNSDLVCKNASLLKGSYCSPCSIVIEDV